MSDSAPGAISNEELDALLRQLRTQPRAQPQPFFYARLTARLSAPSPGLPIWMLRPVYAIVLGAIMLALSGDGTASGAVVAANDGTPTGIQAR